MPFACTSANISRVQQLLRMAYAHVQMILYRPFLHYVSQFSQRESADKRSYACAAACVSVSRNIIHITAEMKKRGMLNGAYWFTMYTTFFAILSLVFFVLENPESPASKDIYKEAMEGKDTLASLAKRSMAADRCTVTLAVCSAAEAVLILILSIITAPVRPTSGESTPWSRWISLIKQETSCAFANTSLSNASST